MSIELTAPLYRIFFTAALAMVRAERAAYDAEVDEWYREGDGAPAEWVEAGTQPWFDFESGDDPSRPVNIGGRGYRFPQCPHGMSLWTDYDNICGRCEDSLTAIQEAQGIARSRCREYVRRINAAIDLNGVDGRPEEAVKALMSWANDMLPRYPK